MSYPNTIPAVRDALTLLAYGQSTGLPRETQTKLVQAASHGSPVEAFHQAIDALVPHVGIDLSDDGLRLVAGATRLCTSNGWSDRHGHNYAAVFTSAVQALPADPEPQPEDEAETSE